MLNFLLFLSMVYEYAYFVMNIFGKRSIDRSNKTEANIQNDDKQCTAVSARYLDPTYSIMLVFEPFGDRIFDADFFNLCIVFACLK